MAELCEVLGEGDRTKVEKVTAISGYGAVSIGPLGAAELYGVLYVLLEPVKARVEVTRSVATAEDSAAILL